jgi:hypothetical protein
MNREQKERAAEIVKQGGRKVQELTLGLNYYDATVELTPDEYFGSHATPDGDDVAVLHLLALRK